MVLEASLTSHTARLVQAFRRQLIGRCATEGLPYGCRSRWAKRLGVEPSTIAADLDIILRQHLLKHRSGTPGNRAAGHGRRNGQQDHIMSTRLMVRLSPDVHGELKRRARQQGQSLAAFIRQHLKNATMPTEPSAVPPGETRERWLMTGPPEVQTRVPRTTDHTGLPLDAVCGRCSSPRQVQQTCPRGLDVPMLDRSTGERRPGMDQPPCWSAVHAEV
jgi:HicB family